MMPKTRDDSMLRADPQKLLIAIGNAGMNLQELAVASGVGYNVICLMRRGRLMKPWKLGKVCKALNIKVEDIVKLDVGEVPHAEEGVVN